MRKSLICAALLAVGVLAGGCHLGNVGEESGGLTQVAHPILPATTSLAAAGISPAIPAPPSPASATPTDSASALPVSVSIPAIEAQSSLMPLGLNPDGTVQVPPVSTPMQAGWYADGAAPGQDGPAVLLGHVDGDHQAGIFYRLHELTPGARVMVTRADGSVLTFVVTKIDKVSKNAFPTAAVYGPTKDPQLRLITCGGSFDPTAHSYVDNIIVYASLA